MVLLRKTQQPQVDYSGNVNLETNQSYISRQRLKTSPRNTYAKKQTNGFMSDKRYSYGRDHNSYNSSVYTTNTKTEERMWSEFNLHFQNSRRKIEVQNHQDFVRNYGVMTNLEQRPVFLQVSKQAEILLEHNHLKRKQMQFEILK